MRVSVYTSGNKAHALEAQIHNYMNELCSELQRDPTDYSVMERVAHLGSTVEVHLHVNNEDVWLKCEEDTGVFCPLPNQYADDEGETYEEGW